jgi:UDPglucose--hexose-1-phosphate uridylyltransferase
VAGELRIDPLSGRQVVVAPGRARRPGVGVPVIEEPTEQELETCPFCEGREDRTPPESLALPERQPADSPGWRVRVVPNLYPAFERQEVVVHSPRHVRSFAELEDEEVQLAAEAWARRVQAARAEGFGYVHALINEGRAAGASLPHSHSQLVWMRERPPAVVEEGDLARREFDLLREIQSRRDPAELEVDSLGDLVAVCPPASRVPYEVLILNGHLREHGAFTSEHLPVALRLLRDVVRRLRAVEGPVPWNAWVHEGEDSWHVELVPRLTILAGIELGAGIYVNTLPPEDAAAALRAASL